MIEMHVERAPFGRWAAVGVNRGQLVFATFHTQEEAEQETRRGTVEEFCRRSRLRFISG